MNRKFFIGSVGRPDEGYDEENLQRCIENVAHFMHKDTIQKGVFDQVHKDDVFILKFREKFIAYGEVICTEVLENDKFNGWTYLVKVKKWYFYSETDHKKGIGRYGVNDHIVQGSQYATIKEIDRDYGLNKVKELSVNSQEFYNKLVSEENMNEYEKLLEKNKNLILTGAPGTGKTYLAKKIAEQMISKNVQLKPLDILKQAIVKYEREEYEEKPDYQLLADFTKRFPKEKLNEMSLDDYCIGRADDSKDSFCYWIERRLNSLGYYSPGSSKSYLLYWNKTDQKYEITGYLKDNTDDSPESLMRVLASDIHRMVNENSPQLFANKFGESFILKILNSYYPHQYAPINSRIHINRIISLFNIPCDSENVFEKNKAVYCFYERMCKGNRLSAFDFMRIIYDNFNIKDEESVQNGVIETAGEYSLVQFHPSYDYSDFVEGLRPIQKEKDVVFIRADGVFKQFCKKALRNPNKSYVMIVDEINRGEISKIFGELFFSIDPDYRGKKGKVRTQYANLQTSPNEFDSALDITDPDSCGHFFVPKNMYIIGTMNDIDRSVESMDFAFRRRFAFKEVIASENTGMLDILGDELRDAAVVKMNNLNAAIENCQELGRQYQIGAAYFLKLQLYEGSMEERFNSLWENHLRILLEDYLRGLPGRDEKLNAFKAEYDK